MPFLNRCGLDKQNQDILLNSGLLQVSGKKNVYPDNESRVGRNILCNGFDGILTI